MKGNKLFIAALCAVGTVLCVATSCSNDDDPNSPVWNGIKSPDDAKVFSTIKGDFDITDPHPGSTVTVTLSAFPGSLRSFLYLQEHIGTHPVGAAILPLVGMEVYYQRGSKIGLECIKSACTASTFTDRLQQRLLDMYKGTDANCFRPYQVAAFLKGASPDNGYNPTRPYTFDLTYQGSEKSELLGGTVYTFRLKYSGSETSKDVQIQTVRPAGQPYYIASSWSSCYVYVKQISVGQTFHGLD